MLDVRDRDDRLTWFKTVILPYQAVLRQRLRRVVRNAQDVDDLLAEVMARTYAFDGWREIRHGLAFATRTAHNILIDQQRREVIVSFDYMADLDTLNRSISYDGMLDARDALRRLEAIVDTLPPQQRRTFLLRRVHGHSAGEIADIMAISVSTVEKHLTRALASIATAMAGQEDHGSVEHVVVAGGQDGNPGRSGVLGDTPR